MLHIANTGTLGRQQLFYHTFVAHYFGLSRGGIDTLSRYGYVLPLRSFDSCRIDILADNQATIRSNTHTNTTHVAHTIRTQL